MARIVILGGGLTGLSAAYNLEKSGFFDYKIFEKNSSNGGLLRSVKKDGFTFDYTGHLLHTSNDNFKEFISKIVGFENLIEQRRKSFIFSNNTYTNYPFQENLAGLPAGVISDCITGFLKRKTSIKSAQTFKEWVLKYFGAGFGKHFFYPYNSKLLCQTIDKIHPSWTGRFVPKTKLETIIEGIANGPSASRSGYNSKFFYPKSGGIQTIIDALVRNIKTPIVNNHEAVEINRQQKIVTFSNGKTEPYEHLVSTMPLPHLLKRLNKKNNSSFKNAGKKLFATNVINFNIGVDVENISNKHWVYVPEKKYDFYRFGFWKNFSPTMAPSNASSIYGELSYRPEITNNEKVHKLVEKSANDTLKILGLSNNNIILRKDLLLENAYVIFDHWREKNIKRLHKSIEKSAIYSVGRFGEWKYSSMQEAFLDGKDICDQLVKAMCIPAKKPSTLLKNVASGADFNEQST